MRKIKKNIQWLVGCLFCFVAPVALCLSLMCACCRERGEGTAATNETKLQDVESLDEIIEIEKVIEDSTLLNNEEEPSWEDLGNGTVRVRTNGKRYLRMTENDGYVTSLTYKYDR
jgi:hypothetical protein